MMAGVCPIFKHSCFILLIFAEQHSGLQAAAALLRRYGDGIVAILRNIQREIRARLAIARIDGAPGRIADFQRHFARRRFKMHLQAIALPQRQRVRIRAIHAGNGHLVGVGIFDAAASKLWHTAAQKQRSNTRAHKQR